MNDYPKHEPDPDDLEVCRVDDTPWPCDARGYLAYPHDPAGGRTVIVAGNPCNRHCPGDYPCTHRRAQRADRAAMVDYLQGDLYRRAADPEPGATWESPLGWKVWYCYGETGLLARIIDPSGKVFAETDCATDRWLEAKLP